MINNQKMNEIAERKVKEFKQLKQDRKSMSPDDR